MLDCRFGSGEVEKVEDHHVSALSGQGQAIGTADAASVVRALNSIKHYNKGVLGATTYSKGFPLRPIAMQKWVWNAKKHKLHDQFLAFVNPPASKVPAP